MLNTVFIDSAVVSRAIAGVVRSRVFSDRVLILGRALLERRKNAEILAIRRRSPHRSLVNWLTHLVLTGGEDRLFFWVFSGICG